MVDCQLSSKLNVSCQLKLQSSCIELMMMICLDCNAVLPFCSILSKEEFSKETLKKKGNFSKETHLTHLSLFRLLLGSECVCAAFAEMGKKVNCEIAKKGQL